MKYIANHKLNTEHWDFIYYLFQYWDNNKKLIVLKSIEINNEYYVRIQHSCILWTTFKSNECDCWKQLYFSMKYISEHWGLIFYFVDNEWSGLWLIWKSLIQMEEFKTKKSFPEMNKKISEYNLIKVIPKILDFLKLKKEFWLITNNPSKVKALKKLNISVKKIINIKYNSCNNFTDFAKKELEDKKKILNHIIKL